MIARSIDHWTCLNRFNNGKSEIVGTRCLDSGKDLALGLSRLITAGELPVEQTQHSICWMRLPDMSRQQPQQRC